MILPTRSRAGCRLSSRDGFGRLLPECCPASVAGAFGSRDSPGLLGGAGGLGVRGLALPKVCGRADPTRIAPTPEALATHGPGPMPLRGGRVSAPRRLDLWLDRWL